MKKRFSEEQIIDFLKEANRGVPVKDCAASWAAPGSVDTTLSKFSRFFILYGAYSTQLPMRPFRIADSLDVVKDIEFQDEQVVICAK